MSWMKIEICVPIIAFPMPRVCPARQVIYRCICIYAYNI
jgi:hypothetical protein